jgi:hypothetical protein
MPHAVPLCLILHDACLSKFAKPLSSAIANIVTIQNAAHYKRSLCCYNILRRLVQCWLLPMLNISSGFGWTYHIGLYDRSLRQCVTWRDHPSSGRVCLSGSRPVDCRVSVQYSTHCCEMKSKVMFSAYFCMRDKIQNESVSRTANCIRSCLLNIHLFFRKTSFPVVRVWRLKCMIVILNSERSRYRCRSLAEVEKTNLHLYRGYV